LVVTDMLLYVLLSIYFFSPWLLNALVIPTH
jgi:hypothetical protein